MLYAAVGALFGPDALRKTPPLLISKANSQAFRITEEQQQMVAGMIDSLLRLPKGTLRELEAAQLLALGVRYHQHRRLLRPLDTATVATVDQALKTERGGKSRATVHHRAARLLDLLAA